MPNFVNDISPVGAKVYAKGADGGVGFVPSGQISPQFVGYNVALLGDSQVAIGASSVGTVSSITQTLGVATLTTSSNHSIQAGDRITIRCTGSADYNGLKTVLTVPTNTTATFAISTSAPATATGTIEAWLVHSKTWRTPFHAANAFLGNRFRLAVNAGIGGEQTTAMLDRIFTDVLPSNPKMCILIGGINDLLNSRTAAQIAGTIDEIATTLRDNGIIPAISTIPPTTTAYAGTNTALRKGIADTNYLIRDLCNDNGYLLLDTFASLVDPASANSEALSGVLSTDGLHLAFRGAYLAGAAWADVLKYVYPSLVDTLPKSAGDVWAHGNNILTNPLLTTTTGGVVGSGITGDSPADWRVSKYGSVSGIISSEARTVSNDGDVFGNNVKVACTATLANCGVDIDNPTQAQAAFATSGAGYYVFEGHAQVKNSSINMNVVSVFVQFTSGGRNITINAASSGGLMVNEATGFNLKFKTEPFYIPSGSTAITPWFTAVPSAPGTWEMYIGRVAFRKVA